MEYARKLGADVDSLCKQIVGSIELLVEASVAAKISDKDVERAERTSKNLEGKIAEKVNSMHDLEAEMVAQRHAFVAQRKEWRKLIGKNVRDSLECVLPPPSEGAKQSALSVLGRLENCVRECTELSAGVCRVWDALENELGRRTAYQQHCVSRCEMIGHASKEIADIESTYRDAFVRDYGSWFQERGHTALLEALQQSKAACLVRASVSEQEHNAILPEGDVSKHAFDLLKCVCGAVDKSSHTQAQVSPRAEGSSNDFSCLSMSEFQEPNDAGRVHELEKTISKLREQLEAERVQAKECEKYQRKKIGELEEIVSSLSEHLDAASQEDVSNEKRDTTVDCLWKDQESARREIQLCSRQRERLQKELNAAKSSGLAEHMFPENLRVQLEATRDEVKEIGTNTAERRAALEDMGFALQERQTAFQEVGPVWDEKRAALEERHASLESSGKELKTVGQEAESYESGEFELQRQIATLRTEATACVGGHAAANLQMRSEAARPEAKSCTLEVAEMQKELDALHREKKSHKNGDTCSEGIGKDLIGLRLEVQMYQEGYERLEVELGTLRQDVEKEHAAAGSLRNELEACQKQVKDACFELQKVRKELQIAREEVKERHVYAVSVEKDLESAKQEVQSYMAVLRSSQQEVQEGYARAASLEKELTKCNQAIEKAHDHASCLETEIHTSRKAFQETHTKAANLEKELQCNKKVVQEGLAIAASLQGELDAAKQGAVSNREGHARTMSLEKELFPARQEAASHQRGYALATNLQNELASTEQMSELFKEGHARTCNLQKELDSAKLEITFYQEGHIDLQTELQSIMQEVKEGRVHAASLMKELDIYRQEIESLKGGHAMAANLQKELKFARQEITSLRQSLADTCLQQEFCSATNEVESLRGKHADTANLQGKLDSARNEIKALKERVVPFERFEENFAELKKELTERGAEMKEREKIILEKEKDLKERDTKLSERSAKLRQRRMRLEEKEKRQREQITQPVCSVEESDCITLSHSQMSTEQASQYSLSDAREHVSQLMSMLSGLADSTQEEPTQKGENT